MGKEGTTALTALIHSSAGSTANPCSSHLRQVARELTDALLFGWMSLTPLSALPVLSAAAISIEQMQPQTLFCILLQWQLQEVATI